MSFCIFLISTYNKFCMSNLLWILEKYVFDILLVIFLNIGLNCKRIKIDSNYPFKLSICSRTSILYIAQCVNKLSFVASRFWWVRTHFSSALSPLTKLSRFPISHYHSLCACTVPHFLVSCFQPLAEWMCALFSKSLRHTCFWSLHVNVHSFIR